MRRQYCPDRPLVTSDLNQRRSGRRARPACSWCLPGGGLSRVSSCSRSINWLSSDATVERRDRTNERTDGRTDGRREDAWDAVKQDGTSQTRHADKTATGDAGERMRGGTESESPPAISENVAWSNQCRDTLVGSVFLWSLSYDNMALRKWWR